MPLLDSPKAPDEHLIFVKNVPGYVGTDTIRSMFDKYNPTSVKNVYPNSNVTTVVVGFRTKAEAARAQEETDQTRLEHVVLKVEIYNQRQSVRYLRDHGQPNRPLGAAKEDEPGYLNAKPAQEEASIFTPPLEPHVAKDPATAPRGTTWADIAGNRHAQVKEVPKAGAADSPATGPSTPTSTPHIPIAVPRKLFAPGHRNANSPPQAALSLGHSTPEALAIPPSPSARSTDTSTASTTDEIGARVRAWDNIASWQAVTQWAIESSSHQPTRYSVEPLDTTARIRARHCADCAFCRLRELS
jgi:hypothetical protein